MSLLTPPPTPVLQRGDRSTFANRLDAFITWLINFVAEMIALVAGLNSLAAGGSYSIQYIFDGASTADGDPGPGNLRLSNATQNAATVLRLDLANATGQDVTGILDGFDASTSTIKGSIRLQKMGDPTKWLTFDVTARAAPGGYRNITIVNTGGSSASPFVNGDGLMLLFTRNGDKGDLNVYPMLHLREEKPSGTAGTANAPGIETRGLNTVKKNTVPGASLSGNQFVLPAGTYRFRGGAPAGPVNGHQALLYCVSDSAYVAVGTSEYSVSSTTVITRSRLDGEIVVASSKTYELRHYRNAAGGSAGGGLAAGGGQVEVYAEIIFEKVA